MEENSKVKELQRVLLECIQELVSILNEYNLKYYMLGGTFLGAVRHKGFIPWDDDLDIAMPREDYEKFIEIATTKLKEKFELIHYSNSKEVVNNPFARIINKDCTITVNRMGHTKEINAFIDIFPLDGFYENPMLKIIHKIRLNYRYSMIRLARLKYYNNISVENRGILEKVIIFLNKKTKIFSKLNLHKAYFKFERVLKSCDYKKAKYIFNSMGSYGLYKEFFKKEDFNEGKRYEFENTYLMGAENYNAILTKMYGDYMKLPPKEKQVCRHIIDVKNNKN